MNTLLYGRDDEQRIVGLAQHSGDSVQIWTRLSETEVTSRVERLRPYAYFTDTGWEMVRDDYGGYDHYALKGKGAYRHMLVFQDWRAHWKVVNAVRKAVHNGEEGVFRDEVYYHYSVQQQYLTQTGKTLYQGMTQQSVKRMQFDIEVYSSTGAFPLAENDGDMVFMCQLSDNFGWEKLLVIDRPEFHMYDFGFEVETFADERDLLRGLVREFHRQDPDVIEGHNVLAFDFPYVMDRCEKLGVEFGVGRDNTVPRSWGAQKKLAERELSYQNLDIAGRSVVDTMFLAGAYDVFTRALDGLGLKPTAQHFRDGDGITYEEQHGHPREYIEGDEISAVWEADPLRLARYAMDDVRETRYLSDKLAGATFYLTQMVPLSYQETHLAGTGRQIESIMVRQYLTSMYALPQPETGRQQHGGYTDIFRTGRYRNIVYLDVASLYPSIMTRYACHPESDELGVHDSMLVQLTDLRLAVKAQANASKDPALKAELRAREQSFKVVINSCYGVMGDSFSLFNDFSEADRVAINGQLLLKRMMHLIEKYGGTIIECDTDGVLASVPEDWSNMRKEALVRLVSYLMPEGINVDNDGFYDVMISVAKKNYALRGYDGKVKLKGGAFKSRQLERFGREYLGRQLGHLFDADVAAMHEEHLDMKHRVMARGLDVGELEKKANLKDSMKLYESKVSGGGSRRAQYELARYKGERDGRPPLKGDVIRYFMAGHKKSPTGFLDSRLSEEWTPGDENVHYYLKRLGSFADRFALFFAPDDFKRVFPADATDPRQQSLFGGHTYDISGIELANKTIKDTPSLSPLP